MNTCNSTTVTHSIRVETTSFYVPDRSDVPKSKFFFAYRIRITNEGDASARLASRHWIITDGLGNVEEIRGPGVVGKQPRLEPGEHHTYTSACPLSTEWGTMRGTYRMVRDDGTEFDAAVGPFRLLVDALQN